MFVEKVFPTTLMGKDIIAVHLYPIYISLQVWKNWRQNFFLITNKVKNYFLNGASEEKMSDRRPPLKDEDIIRNAS